MVIEKKNPLKQGLKPLVEYGSGKSVLIEKKNPLKQGLKRKHDKEQYAGI